MTLLPPAESMRVAATILLKNIELKHTNNTNSSIRSQIEVHVKFCYYLFCILLFACLLYCSKMNSTYSCRSLFCFVFVFVVVVLFLFQFLFVFFIICFELLHFLFSLCVQLDDRIAGLSSTLFVHMHRYDMTAVALVCVSVYFDFILICCTRNMKQSHTMGLVKPHNTQLIRLNKCPNQ